MPERIQLKRTKGWRMPPNTVKVDRTTLFGNPFPVDVYGRDCAVDLFRRWLSGNMSSRELSECSRQDRYSDGPVSLWTVRGWLLEEMEKLRGKNLACWCGEGPCHADVLLEAANR